MDKESKFFVTRFYTFSTIHGRHCFIEEELRNEIRDLIALVCCEVGYTLLALVCPVRDMSDSRAGSIKAVVLEKPGLTIRGLWEVPQEPYTAHGTRMPAHGRAATCGSP